MRAEELARRVAERAAEAWYGHHVSDDDQAAVGVVAALALLGKATMSVRADGHLTTAKALAAGLVKLSDEEITHILATTWAEFWMLRPDLARHTMPLHEWLEDEPRKPPMVKATAMVARAAARAGLFELTAFDRLHDADLIGATYMEMKPTKARQARGEFYTPPDVCSLMARFTLGDTELKPGMKIGEPSAGTGGMIRAAAEVIRQRGMDPADFWWIANDVSHVSVAGLAVNLFLWDVGPRTIIGVADTLLDPAWYEREWEKSRGAIAHRDDLLSTARMLAAFRRADALLAGGPEQRPEPEDELEPAPLPAPEPPAARPLAAAAKPVPSRVPAGPVVQLSLFDELPA